MGQHLGGHGVGVLEKWHPTYGCAITVVIMPNKDREQKTVQVHVGPQGRIVIPAQFREALDMRAGQILVARADDGRLVLEKREQILARLQDTFAQVPNDVSLVDELIAERREEARKEAEG